MEKDLRLDNIERLYALYHDTLIKSSKWSSSALELDNQITARGYKTREKFFHQYNLPEINESLAITSDRMWLYAFLDENLRKIEKVIGQNILLSPELNAYLQNIRPKTVELIEKYAKAIRDKNAGLKDIKLPRLIDRVHFIRGAAYGFPPENIELWVQNYPNDNMLNQAFKQQSAIKEKFGIDVGLMRMTSRQADQLMAELSAQYDKKGVIKNAAAKIQDEPLQELARLDPYIAWQIERGMMDY